MIEPVPAAGIDARPIRLALVDGHRLFQESFRALVEKVPGFSVVAHASSARESFPALENEDLDAILVARELPGSSGITLVREIVRREILAKTVVLADDAEREFVVEAFVAGANGYALKSQSAGEVFFAILSVVRGGTYLPSSIQEASVIEEVKRRARDAGSGPLVMLSAREREVFELAIRPLSNRAIARELHISEKTVETHRLSINRKLCVHSTGALVRFAAQHGLLPKPQVRESSPENLP